MSISMLPILLHSRPMEGARRAVGYEDIPGFCASAPTSKVAKLEYVLTTGRYVGMPDDENDFNFEGELEKSTTVKKSLTVQIEGQRNVNRKFEYYNLDVIISVGYRVKSKQGTQFRIWATQVSPH